MLTCDEILRVLDVIAERLQVPVSELITAMSKTGIQEFSPVISASVILIIFIGLTYKVNSYLVKHRKQCELAIDESKNEFIYDDTTVFIWRVVLFLSFCGILIMCDTLFINIKHLMLWIYDPKAYGINKLLMMMTQLHT